MFYKAALGVCGWCERCMFMASCTTLVAVGTIIMLGSGNYREVTYALL